jgi:hypothetical protein
MTLPSPRKTKVSFPQPWKAENVFPEDDCGWKVFDAEGKEIIAKSDERTARAIAAAPEMLDTLRQAILAMSRLDGLLDWTDANSSLTDFEKDLRVRAYATLQRSSDLLKSIIGDP